MTDPAERQQYASIAQSAKAAAEECESSVLDARRKLAELEKAAAFAKH